jgi:hypothetical protein
MIRRASLAALCAFGLSNVAQASVALTAPDTTETTVKVTTLGSAGGALQFSTTPVPLGSDGVSLSGGEQAVTSIVGDGGSLQLGSSGGSATITNLTFNTTTGALFGQLTGGGNLTISPGLLVGANPLIISGGDVGSGSTIVVAPVTVDTPAEIPETVPLGNVIPPSLPLFEPALPHLAGMTCSGAFSVAYGAQTSVNCQADLWITQGVVFGGQSIQVNALGNILVDDVHFHAPTVLFNTPGYFVSSPNTVWFGGDTTINALGVNFEGDVRVATAGSLNINSQTISHNPAVPEPGTWALMGMGLVGLSLAARRKA